MGQTSANTEYIMCAIICTTGGTGSAAVTQPTPHAIYSSLTGGTVVQLNSIELGGFNGVNC
jgi:hypothetical protein